MIRRWSFLRKLQKFHKYNLDSFHSNGIISSYVAVSPSCVTVPNDWGKVRQAEIGKLKL